MPRQKRNKESEAIRRMIHGHLQRSVESAMAAAPLLAGAHLDEDALAVFVEGSLSEAESKSVVAHLVSCHACRHTAAQLIRLQSSIGENELTRDVLTPPDRNRFIRLLDDLAARVLPEAGDREVLAYHASTEDLEEKKEKDVTEETENGDSKR